MQSRARLNYIAFRRREKMNVTNDTRDSDYFRRRAAEARAAAFCKDYGESVEVAGDLALAYAALARRRAAIVEPAEPAGEAPAIKPILLQE